MFDFFSRVVLGEILEVGSIGKLLNSVVLICEKNCGTWLLVRNLKQRSGYHIHHNIDPGKPAAEVSQR